nr:MAG TPA: reticulocyte binding/rhoptry protein [Caudoviricetes sp.]
MLLYFALDDEHTCFHSSKIFNDLKELYDELINYRNNVHYVYSTSLFVYDTVSNKECSIIINANDIKSLSFERLKSYVNLFTTYYNDGMVIKSIKCDVSGDDCGNFGHDFVTVTFEDSSELLL